MRIINIKTHNKEKIYNVEMSEQEFIKYLKLRSENMAKIKKVQDTVYEILSEDEETRKDDYVLILRVFERYISPNTQLRTVCQKHKQLGLPSIHTIVRVRRKLQVEHPELMDEETKKIRSAEEEEYKQYALEV